jgi:hypothetical protein
VAEIEPVPIDDDVEGPCGNCGKMVHTKEKTQRICLICNRYYCRKCGRTFACNKCMSVLPHAEQGQVSLAHAVYRRGRIMFAILEVLFLASIFLMGPISSMVFTEINGNLILLVTVGPGVLLNCAGLWASNHARASAKAIVTRVVINLEKSKTGTPEPVL